MHHPAVIRCAVVKHGEQNLLCLELANHLLDSVRERFPEYNYLEFIQLKSIPMDKRHNAKVDYPALRRELERLFS